MKRNKPPKRRDRKTGRKTYLGKRPATYSTAYHTWRSTVAANVAHREDKERERHLAEKRKIT